MSSKRQNMEPSLRNSKRDHPCTPSLSHLHPWDTDQQRDHEEVELLLHLPLRRCAPFIHTPRAAGIVTFYCCYLCGVSTDNRDGADTCTFSCMKRSRCLLWHKLASVSTTCLIEPAGLQQCRQTVSGRPDPQ